MSINLSMDSVAQTAHVALGALGVLLPVAKMWPHGQLIGSVVMIVYAIIKEAWFDEHYEDAVTRGSGLRDFAFYALGIFAANVVLWL